MDQGSERRRPRGRPALPDNAGKRYSVGIRTTKEIRDSLKDAADASGRSIAQEIELRIERSFDTEKAYGGPRLAAVFRSLASAAAERSAALEMDVFEDYAEANSLLAQWRDTLNDRLLPAQPEKATDHQNACRGLARQLIGDELPANLKRDIAALLSFEADNRANPPQFRQEVRVILEEFKTKTSAKPHGGEPLTREWSVSYKVTDQPK